MADASIDSMSALLALDVAILLPRSVAARAIAFSAALPRKDRKGLRLDAAHLPHITLTQQFVAVDELSLVWAQVTAVLRSQPPLRLHVPSAVRSRQTVWMAIERSPELVALHTRLMEALCALERRGGTTDDFAGSDARPHDVAWVRAYRANASGGAFLPHVTLGHATTTPRIESFDFDATVVAACHLGRFCTCRDVLRRWTLSDPSGRSRPSSTGTHSRSA